MAWVSALLCATLLWLGKDVLAHTFSKDAAVAAAAAAWLAWVAAYHIADALQAVCVFLLRCYRITLRPLLIYTTLLWGVGLWGGYVLAYQGLGTWANRPSVDSFWITSTAALALVTALFLGLLWRAMPQRTAQT